MTQDSLTQTPDPMDRISFQQKSTGLSLIITSSAALYYIANVWALEPRPAATNILPEGYGSVILTTTILFILAQIVLQVVLAIGSGSAAEAAITSAEKVASLKATRNAYTVLVVSVFAGIVSFFWSELIPFYAVDILVTGFVLSELVRFASQLVLARR